MLGKFDCLLNESKMKQEKDQIVEAALYTTVHFTSYICISQRWTTGTGMRKKRRMAEENLGIRRRMGCRIGSQINLTGYVMEF